MRNPRGVAWNPAAASATARGCSAASNPSPSARSTVRRPSAPSRTASASASAAACRTARSSVHESSDRPRRAPRTAPARRRRAPPGRRPCGPACASAAPARHPGRPVGPVGPGQRRAVRVGGVGRGEHHGGVPAARGRVRRRADGTSPQPVDGAGRGELRGAEALDEVAATHPARVLEGRQHAVGGGEPAGDALGDDRSAGDHAVPFEQELRDGVRPHGRVLLAGGQQRPPPRHRSAGRRGTGGRRARPRRADPSADRTAAAVARAWCRGRLRCAVRPATEPGAQRRERVVGEHARPDEVPQRGDERRVVLGTEGTADGVGERAEEAGAAAGQHGEDRSVQLVPTAPGRSRRRPRGGSAARVSAGCSATQPSSPGSGTVPRPQISPAAVSSSSSAGL